ncbi:hypothetical protein DFH06DRAFT_1116517 [Mycena polygramma]|nr:hypothetical protein DFH06DRAFT_1116517 [Mycena polygramma]
MGKRQSQRRGTRSPRKAKARHDAYMQDGGVYERGQELKLRLTKTHTVDSFPAEFLKMKRDNAVAVSVVATEYPGRVTDLPTLSDDPCEILLVPAPAFSAENLKKITPCGLPKYLEKRARAVGLSSVVEDLNEIGPIPFLLLRCTGVISEHIQALFWHAWIEFLAAGGTAFHKRGDTRSDTPGFHFGIWNHYMGYPQITGDTNQTAFKGDPSDVIVWLNRFLLLIKNHLVPKARAILQEYAPQQLAILQPVHERVKSHLGPELAARPQVDWDGVFFAAAVKEGQSEKIHIDFNDPLALLTFIFVMSRPGSQWEGGEFCCPQLGHKIPFRGGQLLAVRTRALAHCGATVTGTGGRLCITCFSPSQTLEQALFGTAKGKNAPSVIVFPFIP